MYNNPYYNTFNAPPSVDTLNNQIAELEKLKSQMQARQQQAVQQPTNLTQNFSLAPTQTQSGVRYVNGVEDVRKELVFGDTPFFDRDYTLLWVKNAKGEIKSYELKEIIEKDDKDLYIEQLEGKLNDLMKELENNAKSINEPVVPDVKSTKPTTVSTSRRTSKK